MTYSCRPDQKSNHFADDLKITRVYSSGFEKERDIIYHPDFSAENDGSIGPALSEQNNVCHEVVFFDGNDADFEASEDEHTLIERVWWSSEPPKIPMETCVVPARRIQVIKERLSSVVKGLSTLSEALHIETKKNARRQRVGSDFEYVKVRSFDDTNLASCQTEMITIVPTCALSLKELL